MPIPNETLESKSDNCSAKIGNGIAGLDGVRASLAVCVVYFETTVIGQGCVLEPERHDVVGMLGLEVVE